MHQKLSAKQIILLIALRLSVCVAVATTLRLVLPAPSVSPSASDTVEDMTSPDDAELVASAELEDEPEPTPPEPAIDEAELEALSTQYGKSKYYVLVNRAQNVVMVYALDASGDYTRLAKTFVSSVGRPDSETPLGVFTVQDRYDALYLVGDVWGQYAVRIDGPYFFHSVPYFSRGNPSWDDLEYLEYNKLGSGASAGCVRLAAVDAKWIYDNIAYGTTVEIYDADTLPDGIVKPTPITIDEASPYRGWDPTDPDPANPWLHAP